MIARDATPRDATPRDATTRDATPRCDATTRDATNRDAPRRQTIEPPSSGKKTAAIQAVAFDYSGTYLAYASDKIWYVSCPLDQFTCVSVRTCHTMARYI